MANPYFFTNTDWSLRGFLPRHIANNTTGREPSTVRLFSNFGKSKFLHKHELEPTTIATTAAVAITTATTIAKSTTIATTNCSSHNK